MSFFSQEPLQTGHQHSIVENELGNQLWLGDFAAAEDLQRLRSNNVRTGTSDCYQVISATSGMMPQYDSTIAHHQFVIRDAKNANIFIHFERVSNWIETGLQRGSVLVHCGAGASRSATLVIAYLMRSQRLTFQQALNYCRKKRPQTCPNIGFERQLKLYQRNLHIKRGNSHSNVSKDEELPPLNSPPKRLTMDRKPQRASEELRTPSLSKEVWQRQDTPVDLLSKYLKRMAEFRFGVSFDLNRTIKSSVRFRK